MIKTAFRDSLIMMFLACNIAISLGTVSLYLNLKNAIVFDMDKVRHDYARDMEMALRLGCMEGTEYPEEYKLSTVGYNVNSPPMWCGKYVDRKQDWLSDQLYNLGKKTWGY